jgi:hypothetical protein
MPVPRLLPITLLVIALAGPVLADEPVRMGCGLMTFDTVPGWGLDEQGKSQIGPTHGSVVVDSKGQVYTSSNLGIFVFTPAGQLVRRHLGGDYTGLHDMEIRTESGRDYIYGARNAAGEGIKIDTRYTPPRLLICDRNHQPKGRLLHYDLGGTSSRR